MSSQQHSPDSHIACDIKANGAAREADASNGDAKPEERKERVNGRIMYISTLVILLLASVVDRYAETTTYFLKILKNLEALKVKKRLPEQVISTSITDPWADPKSSEELFNNSTRILWGHWDGGEEELPGFCQLALSSWRARHPDWHVVLLSDENYKEYISMSDLPSTFDSLIVQHRSDIIRLGVLLRYGGVYMDVSTVVLKGFDDIWNAASPNDFFLTGIPNRVSIMNNALLFAPGRDNRILREWQRRVLEYSEAPAATLDEMRAHPAFQKVVPNLDDPNLGMIRDIMPYCAFLWILTDLLYYDQQLRPYIEQHVRFLPPLRWSFDILALGFLGKPTTYDPSDDPQSTNLSKWSMMRSMWYKSLDLSSDDAERANHLVNQINVLRSSTAGVDFHLAIEHHLSQQTTMGRIYRAAVREGPTNQATLNGSIPIRGVGDTKY